MKGFKFRCELENVKDDKEFDEKKELHKKMQQLINVTPFPIEDLCVLERNNDLLLCGEITRLTKKEAEAEYTIFKEKMTRILKEYYPKVKLIDIMKMYFTTID